MSHKVKVDLFIRELQGNFAQVLLGLMLLERQGLISLNIEVGRLLKVGGCNVTATINDHKVLFIDTSDSSAINSRELNNCDYYLKRMLLKEDQAANAKLIPLGLNYIMDTNSLKLFRALLKAKKLQLIYRQAPVFFNFMSFFKGRDYAMAPVPYKNFYRLPRLQKKPVINFYTRLFKPSKNADLNEERISIIRLLRSEFKDHFMGGLRDDPRTRELAPGLAVPLDVTKRANYLRSLQHSDIGISNIGLQGSIGCKVAEYCMSSMAVVQNDIGKFVIPGSFERGKNYRVYDSVEDILVICEELISNPKKLLDMKLENFRYSQHYLQPDKYLWEIILKML